MRGGMGEEMARTNLLDIVGGDLDGVGCFEVRD